MRTSIPLLLWLYWLTLAGAQTLPGIDWLEPQHPLHHHRHQPRDPGSTPTPSPSPGPSVTPSPSPSPAPSTTGVPQYDHVVLVIEENKGYSEILAANPSYIIGTLFNLGAGMTNSFALAHPSEPDYFALYAGSTFGIADDNNYSEPAPSLASILAANAKTFIGYVESASTNNGSAPGNGLAVKQHNPWESFPEGASVEKDFSAFPTTAAGFAALPSASYVIPNNADDMHDGTIAAGDAWLSTHLSAYAQWAVANNSLLIVTWDEDSGPGAGPSTPPANQILTLFYGAHVSATAQSDAAINHYNILATILAGLGIPQSQWPRESQSAAPVTQIFTSTQPNPSPSPSPAPIPPPSTGSGPIWQTWPDRRPLPAFFLTDNYDFSNGNVNGWNWGSVAANGGQTNWAAHAIAAFQAAISTALSQGAQGIIVWDIEGEKGGQSNPAWYGDPQTAALAGIAPEMLQPNSSNPAAVPKDQSLADYCLGLIRAAGLKLGVTSRCDTLNQSATNQSQYTSLAEAVNDQSRKAMYANQRWGATIFYCDSADGAGSPANGGLEFAALHAAFPSFLFIPEFDLDGNVAQNAAGEDIFAPDAAPLTFELNGGEWIDRSQYPVGTMFTVVAVDRLPLSAGTISQDQAAGDIIMHFYSAK
jgi:hypothetical protein